MDCYDLAEVYAPSSARLRRFRGRRCAKVLRVAVAEELKPASTPPTCDHGAAALRFGPRREVAALAAPRFGGVELRCAFVIGFSESTLPHDMPLAPRGGVAQA